MKSKNRRCAYCKKKVPTETAKINGLKAFCSTDHAIAWLETEKGAVTLEKARKARNKIAREKLKTPNDWRDEAQTAFNAWVRFRDRDKGCISCGAMPQNKLGGTMDAGHYRSRGSTPNNLRMHSWNVHAQCTRCNSQLSGNIVEYRKRLIERIGLEKFEWLESQYTPVVRTLEYWQRLKKVFQKRLRIEKKIVDADK